MSASRAGRNAEPDSSVFDGNEPFDDLATLNQERVHGLVDAIDVGRRSASENGWCGAFMLCPGQRAD